MGNGRFEPTGKAEDKPIETATSKGLYSKYVVKKADTGEEVTDCFILRPAKDLAAVAALKEYARVTTNKTLSKDILAWIGEAALFNQPATRESILEAARKCVCGEREQDYGKVENNFQTTANLWMDYLQARSAQVYIEPKDVAVMLALLKIARIATGHAQRDNWIDIAGYAACGGEIEVKEEKENV